ncbi:L-serine ammonia-lyase [Granulibacter bethesdensis]|uniref:L-serine ammonia-lyase n=1 Tax=Granulibacter bethesdensis TaxID=364410 RepID=UPI0003F1DB0C|nr:L-serine ammonia-lyase [Granulibacter bethesdensis]AHJ64440.1 L-serine dehydratase [Granulibacter bethesdensis CGDNIH4]
MISVSELFKVGIGPSSSHTVGPMKAAYAFILGLGDRLEQVVRVRVDLFGSLAWTGKGHGTEKAVLLGLAGEQPDTVDPDAAEAMIARIEAHRMLSLDGRHPICLVPERDVIFDMLTETPEHPNTLAFTAYDAAGETLCHERWCSIGGGFVVREAFAPAAVIDGPSAPYEFRSGIDLLRIGEETGLRIPEIVRTNEYAVRSKEEVDAHITRVIDTMMRCIDRGLSTEGILPGGLNVRRRAVSLLRKMESEQARNDRPPTDTMDRVSLFAIAVNEENAAGGRVVTAPTNGAAGVVPAVLRYYRDMVPGSSETGMQDFILAACAIGALFKMNASISGAEVGCQGEVGVACSMAAAGLAAAMGADNARIENAAEIGMEHHLGMTCDPVAGLVQIPCIERNAFGAIKAINAASLAMRGDGTHHISLDRVIATMRQTGADMQSKYKETSQGGLAVNFTEC